MAPSSDGMPPDDRCSTGDASKPWRVGHPARILTIGSAEPDGATGITADLQVLAAMKVFAGAVTACVGVTRSGDSGRDRVSMPPDMLARQVQAGLNAIDPHAVKVGMMPTSAAIDATVDVLMAQDPLLPLVVEAACVCQNGDPLIDADAIANLKRRLIVGATILVASVRDAEILAGMAINTLEEKRNAAVMLRTIGAETVVLIDTMAHGGRVADYVAGPGLDDQGDLEEVMDYPRPSGWRVRGISGAMAAASAVGLARGLSPVDAVRMARTYVAEAVRHSRSMARGNDESMVCAPWFPV